MPRGITGLGSRGHQAVSHGPLAAWRSHGGEHDCAPPVCGAFQLLAGCRCNTLGPLHSVHIPVGMSRPPLVRCLGAFPTMWSQRPETFRTPRWKHHSQLHAGQWRHVSVVAACLPVAGCRPPSPQCGMANGGPNPCKRVDVQWETRSARCAVTSGTETLRPLIHVACAGSSDSSISMLLGVAARSSPAVVYRERPSRSSWCGFMSQITAAEPKRRMLLAK
ncbi:hypothetical protein TCDM_09706 [Trypanosoma cruzi Dm28c]|uniref:Uncharacterized protein n=1 Tax=Trypanosoma cruzi Dm28c TaxID=1416333 RepID=V5B9D1_TRYCR|nr:hypothetical protein TCDM_09706 [Trypanosoma cruzi Dm28c]